jgi:hypothetical protein
VALDGFLFLPLPDFSSDLVMEGCGSEGRLRGSLREREDFLVVRAGAEVDWGVGEGKGEYKDGSKLDVDEEERADVDVDVDACSL